MNINRNKLKKSAAVSFFLVCVSTLVVFFLLFYCQIFYDFGNLAKDRILLSPVYAFCTTPLLFWVSAYLCRRFAQGASGSNMENLEMALAGIKQHLPRRKILSFLSFRVVAICSISSLVSTFGGGSLGREGPSVQMAAGIFFVTAKKLRKFLPKISLENWIYAGAGIGLAVAFGAPMAGLICVYEKAIKLKSNNIQANLFWTLLAILIYLLVVNEPESVFIANQINFHYDIGEISSILLVALICGLITFFFKKTSAFFYKKFVAIKSNLWHLVPISIGLIVAIISVRYGVYAVGGGIKTVNDALGNAQIFSSFGEVTGRIITTILTFISGSAGGTVAPSIAIGGGIGSLAGQFLVSVDPKVFILSGMAAFLGSAIALPITAAFVIFESAAQPFFALPFLLIASLTSFSCSKFINSRV